MQQASQQYESVEKLGKLIPVLRYSVAYEKQARILIGYSHEAMAMGLHDGTSWLPGIFLRTACAAAEGGKRRTSPTIAHTSMC